MGFRDKRLHKNLIKPLVAQEYLSSLHHKLIPKISFLSYRVSFIHLDEYNKKKKKLYDLLKLNVDDDMQIVPKETASLLKSIFFDIRSDFL